MFKYSAITTKGLEAINASVKEGDQIKITRLVYGDGELEGLKNKTSIDEIKSLLRQQTRLKSEKCTLKVFKFEKNEKDLSGAVDVLKVVGVINPESVENDFFAREGGIYAEYKNEEILLAYYISVDYLAEEKKDVASYISKMVLEGRPHYWTINLSMSEASNLSYVFDTDFSLPTIIPVKTDEGYNIEINDHLGKKQIFIKHGKPFTITKTYVSVEEMNSDFENPDVLEGEFVVIENGDLEDPDNSKLYLKTETAFKFITDLSGAQGFTGPQGVGISKIEYTESLKDDDYNVAKVELTDGSVYQFKIKNGKTGDIDDLTSLPSVDTLQPEDVMLVGVNDHGTKISAPAIFNLFFPVGVTYVQYPQQASPNDLWGEFSTWEVIDYDGAFFRAEGGRSKTFIEESEDLVKQSEGLPNIDGTLYFDISTSGTSGYGALSDTYYNNTSGIIGIGGVGKMAILKINASKSNPIYGKSDHVTPENYTMRIWKRTA